MNVLEFNKIAAGVLVGLLLAVGIGKLGDILYAPEPVESAEVADDHADTETTEVAVIEEPVETVSIAVLLQNVDLEAGQKQFRKCMSCHTIEVDGKNKQGPNLYGVVGATQGGNPDFNYSNAIVDLGGSWTFEALNLYLINPKAYAPGTKMVFKGLPDDEDRANLIAWLNSQSDNPLPIPETDDEARFIDQKSHPVISANAGETDVDAIVAMIRDGNVEKGKRVARKCRSCHTFDEGGAHRIGPNLWNMIGQEIGVVDGFRYSSAMENAEGSWTLQRMWSYLENPRKDLPGTRMGFRGIRDEEDLANLIAYLATLSHDPVIIQPAE